MNSSKPPLPVSLVEGLERRRVLGVSETEPLPHPDHIVVNPRAGTVHFRGPMTKEEKEELDLLHERKVQLEAALAELEALTSDPN